MFGGSSDVKADLVHVNPQVAEALKKNTDEAATKTAADYESASMAGIGGPTNYSTQMAQSEKALGGEEPGISGAINQRYQGLVGEKLSSLGNQARLKSYETAANRQASAMQMQTAHNNILAENRRRQKEANDANENARNSALASVLKIGVAIAATIATGGAAAPALVAAAVPTGGAKK